MHVPTLLEWCWRHLQSDPRAQAYMANVYTQRHSPGKFWMCLRCSGLYYSDSSFKPRLCQACRCHEYERIVQSWIQGLEMDPQSGRWSCPNEFQSEITEFGFCLVICVVCRCHFNTKCSFLTIFRMCGDCFEVCAPEMKAHLSTSSPTHDQ